MESFGAAAVSVFFILLGAGIGWYGIPLQPPSAAGKKIAAEIQSASDWTLQSGGKYAYSPSTGLYVWISGGRSYLEVRRDFPFRATNVDRIADQHLIWNTLKSRLPSSPPALPGLDEIAFDKERP